MREQGPAVGGLGGAGGAQCAGAAHSRHPRPRSDRSSRCQGAQALGGRDADANGTERPNLTPLLQGHLHRMRAACTVEGDDLAVIKWEN